MKRVLVTIVAGAIATTLPAHAGVACWWDRKSTCRVSKIEGETNSCRTPDASNCSLAWDGPSAGQSIWLTSGAVYELRDATVDFTLRRIDLEGATSESEIRAKLAPAVGTTTDGFVRLLSWFHMMGPLAGGRMDDAAVPGTDLCVSVGANHGLSRLKVWDCNPGHEPAVPLNEAFVRGDDEAIVLPVRLGARSFAVVLTARSADAADTRDLKGGLTLWRAPAAD